MTHTAQHSTLKEALAYYNGNKRIAFTPTFFIVCLLNSPHFRKTWYSNFIDNHYRMYWKRFNARYQVYGQQFNQTILAPSKIAAIAFIAGLGYEAIMISIEQQATT